MQPKRIISYIEGYDKTLHLLLAEQMQVDFCLYFMESDNYYEEFSIGKTNFKGMGRYPSNKDLQDESFNFELITKLSHNENTIYNLIQRFESRYRTKNKLKNVRTLYLKLLNHAEDLIEKNSIDFIFFYDTPHQPLEYLIFLIARTKNIGVVVHRELPSLHKYRPNLHYCTLNYPLLDERFFTCFSEIKENHDNQELLDLNVKKLYDEFQWFIKTGGTDLIESKAHYGKKLDIKGLKWYFSLRSSQIQSIVGILSKSFKFFFGRLLINRFQKHTLTKYYKNISIKPNLKIKYLYFPLHFQPEATTNPLGGIFMDQFMAIKLIQSLLPKDVLLYVKEHPTYWRSDLVEGMHLVRSKKKYQEIFELENVHFVDITSNPYELILNSLGVITITGTVAFEAFGFNKPAIVLGNYFYNQLANAYHPLSIADLRKSIDEICSNQKDYLKQFIYTLSCLKTISIHLNSSDPKSNREKIVEMMATVVRNLD
jgi:hypothetical protein